MITTLTMTKLTSDTAFNETPHQYMSPPRLIRIIKIVETTMREEAISRPDRMTLTMKTVNKDIPSDLPRSSHMVRYCS